MKSPEDTSSTESCDSTPDSNVPKQKRLKDSSRFWAILIGIDEYPHKPLHGCVSDARSIQKYLNEDLGVPSDHIQCLLGDRETPPTSSPTHANIISALYGLVDNPAIANGDNILIYFAGAGARYDAKEYFREGVKPIDAICPIDRGADSTYDISLREIDGVFSQISREKGATMMNTLILDCGHAPAEDGSVRNMLPLPGHAIEPMLQGAHERLATYPPSPFVPAGPVTAYDWEPETSSHVALGACQNDELAQEVEDDMGAVRGVFTKAVVESLRSGQHAFLVELIYGLPELPDQTPYVAGDYEDEPIWYQE
ncbi:hypothetical protein ARMSODRAFT_1007020 [Armillaria solidipes]|uniref:Peptidase C14 caspase domain-containing protein n=1 Tax=Armillaria solidipes TaxID=1076256 RepID=A0A2H3B4T9_9AGAR|nr:hypothetical protein ARMSODRAFT_1007020 [Armillaria solidipes]